MVCSSVGRWMKLGVGIVLEGLFIYKILFCGLVKLYLKKKIVVKNLSIYIWRKWLYCYKFWIYKELYVDD